MRAQSETVGLTSLIFSTKICCTVGYQIAGLVGLVGLGVSHWWLEIFFRSVAIAGFTVIAVQTLSDTIKHYHQPCKKNLVRVPIALVIMTIGVSQLYTPQTHRVNDLICGPQRATVRQ